MRSIAAGKKGAASKAIHCLLECVQGTQFESYLDAKALAEIAKVVTFELASCPKNYVNLDGFSLE